MGHNFKTQSDTEVLLKMFRAYGINMHDKIEGMYAALILDKKNNKVFFFRDNLGIKPLYYYINKNVFIVCSSLKAIKNISSENRINKNHRIIIIK